LLSSRWWELPVDFLLALDFSDSLSFLEEVESYWERLGVAHER
jgi:hypothetical protein